MEYHFLNTQLHNFLNKIKKREDDEKAINVEDVNDIDNDGDSNQNDAFEVDKSLDSICDLVLQHTFDYVNDTNALNPRDKEIWRNRAII